MNGFTGNAVDLERIFCGALMRQALRPSEAGLTPEDFADAECREVFRAAQMLEGKGAEVSLVTIGAALPGLEAAAVDMLQLNDAAFGVDYLQHARLIHANAQRRKLAEIGRHLVAQAEEKEDPAAMADAAWDALAKTMQGERRLETQNLLLVAQRVLDRRNHPEQKTAVVPCGIRGIDVLLNGGFRAGDLVIVGARPGVGKSALLLSFVRHAASTGRRVLYVSLEMTADQNAERFLAATSGIPVETFITDSPLTARQNEQLADGQTANHAELIEEYDSTGCTALDVRSIARRMMASGGLDLIVIDYLGLMSCVDARNQNRYEQVSEISRSLKALAMELGLPIVAAHQLNRSGAERPELHHLRDSGSIEQDANAVILLHQKEGEPGILLVRVEKNRQGETGGVKLDFRRAVMSFAEVR